MMKRNSLNLFLSSIAAIGIAASILVGGTYALLSSEDKVNIAITSGKVSVTATIDGTSIAKSNDDGTNPNVNAEISDGNTLNISSIKAGEKVTFKINIKNESNIVVKYRAEVTKNDSGDEDLFNALTYTFNDTTSENHIGAWNTLNLNSDKEFTLTCSVFLASETTIDYSAKNCGLVYSIRAIQGNFYTDTE